MIIISQGFDVPPCRPICLSSSVGLAQTRVAQVQQLVFLFVFVFVFVHCQNLVVTMFFEILYLRIPSPLTHHHKSIPINILVTTNNNHPITQSFADWLWKIYQLLELDDTHVR